MQHLTVGAHNLHAFRACAVTSSPAYLCMSPHVHRLRTQLEVLRCGLQTVLHISIGFALALLVTVDSENKTRIVGQALLRNKRTDSFAFVLDQFTKLRHGLRPDVSGVLSCCGLGVLAYHNLDKADHRFLSVPQPRVWIAC